MASAYWDTDTKKVCSSMVTRLESTTHVALRLSIQGSNGMSTLWLAIVASIDPFAMFERNKKYSQRFSTHPKLDQLHPHSRAKPP